MVFSKLVPALGCLCLLSLVNPAAAGSVNGPRVVPGLGPDDPAVLQPGPGAPTGRYGGGFIEFLMTGHSAAAGTPPNARQAGYMASVGPGQEPDDGTEPALTQGGYVRPQPGYEAPRKAVDPLYVRQEVPFTGSQGPGTIVIDTSNKFLYLVEGGGQALRYGIGVGRPGFLWSGEKTITRKAEWPDWTPPAEMIKRRPDLPSHMDGGITNPLGARAMYLGSSLYRIHGTNEPDTIGTNVSSGCIRLTNDDVSDLFSRVHVGTHVIVM